MKSDIKFWENVILSGKKIEPRTGLEESCFKLAEFNLSRKKKKVAA